MTGWQKSLIGLLAAAVIVVFIILGYLVAQPAELPGTAASPASPAAPAVELSLTPATAPPGLPTPTAQPTATGTPVIVRPTPTNTRVIAVTPTTTPAASPTPITSGQMSIPAAGETVSPTAVITAGQPSPVAASSTPVPAVPVNVTKVPLILPVTATPAITTTNSLFQPESSSAPDQVTAPVWLTIPSIAVEAPVVPVGLEPSGIMEAPARADTVGWYKFGPRPGEGSNAVLAGHLDWLGETGVFTRLEELEPGDAIEVQDETGARYRYLVESKQVYEDATAPVAEIFAATPGPMLTLITCTGTYNRATQTYLHRLIVRARGD